MTLWKKLLLGLLALLIISQIPFAYRRYRLGRLQSEIQKLNSQRVLKNTTDSGFVEYKGVAHVHSFLGGHSNGGFEEIIAAAQSNQLDFVVMTEHTSNNFSTADMTLKGNHGGVLFLNGNEASLANGDRLLLVPGLEFSVYDFGNISPPSLEDIATRGRGERGLNVVAYPKEFRGWDTTFYDGIEVYNIYTDAQQINPVVMFFDALWSYRSYPDLLFANFYRRPDENLRQWDQRIAGKNRKVAAFAGNDAHSNVGISLVDGSGKQWLGLKLDPYQRSFRLVRLHVLIPTGQSFSRDALLAALQAGHSFIGFDVFGDTSGFSFTASNGTENKIQGDEIQLGAGVTLTINVETNAPAGGLVKFFRDGMPAGEEYGLGKHELKVTQTGSYRVEVYLPQLPGPVGKQPWIISNPIYVR